MKYLNNRQAKLGVLATYAVLLVLTGIGWGLWFFLGVNLLVAVVPTILFLVVTILGYLLFVWTMFVSVAKETFEGGKNPDWMDIFGTLLIGIFALITSIVMIGIFGGVFIWTLISLIA